jgi:hypothetical protein
VAQRHALFRIENDALFVHDMAGGAQTTRRNGAPLEGEAQLADGDVVSIAGHSLVVEIREGDTALERDGAVTQTAEPNIAEDPVALRLAVLRRALAVASPTQAVALMTTQLERFVATFGTVATSSQEMALITEMAVRLLSETGDARWLDDVLDAHRALGRVLPGDAVDSLFALAAQRKLQRSTALESYVDSLRTRSERLSPAERFVLQRLTGLRERLKA